MTAPGTAVAVQTPTAPSPMTFPQKLAYAKELADSGLLPGQFKKQPASVLWAVEYGEALGLRAVVAMSAIHVIEGKPAPSAAMAAGLIRARGHRLRVYNTPRTDEHKWGTAVAELFRADDPEFPFRAEWSVEDAILADICRLEKGVLLQFTQKNGWQPGNWQKYPRQMMKARALGEVCRDGATDVLLGLHYLAEEYEDAELDSNGQIVSTGSAPTASVPAVITPGPDARPVTAHVRGPDTLPNPEPVVSGPLTRATQDTMMDAFRNAGIGGKSDDDRAKRLRVAEILTDQVLTKSSELSEEDGLIIVDALETAGEDVATYVENLLAEDEAARAEDAAAGENGPDGRPEAPSD
jgi:hypothetical protein